MGQAKLKGQKFGDLKVIKYHGVDKWEVSFGNVYVNAEK